MFQGVSPKIGYRVVLRLFRGITAKLLNNYQISDGDHHTKIGEPARSSLRHFLNISLKLHNYLCSLNKKRKPRRNTLYKYILICNGTQHLLKHLNCSPSLIAALDQLFEAYLILLNRLLYGLPGSYQVVYTEIVTKLAFASLYHEYFLEPHALHQLHLEETQKIFTILLR